MNEIFLLYACDQWKTKASMRLMLATTIQETVDGAISAVIQNGDVDYCGLTGDAAVKAFAEDDDRYSKLEYLYVDIVGDGEMQ